MLQLKTIGRVEPISILCLELFDLDAKIDTGAYSNSIHCDDIKILDDGFVSFKLLDKIHPSYHNKKFILPIYKFKSVKSSNGESEIRASVKVEVEFAGKTYKTIVSLTSRENMRYPMLIGRKFIQDRFLVDVSKKNITKQGWKMLLYILSRNKNLYSTKRLYEEATAKGWEVRVIDYLKCTIEIMKNELVVNYEGEVLKVPDAIIPRIGASRTFFGAAIVRHFEMQDVFSTTGNLALTRSRDKLRSLQVLSKNGVDLPRTVFASNKSNAEDVIALSGGAPLVLKIIEGTQGVGVVLVDSKKAAKSVLDAFYGMDVNLLVQEYIEEANGSDIRAFVVGGEVVAAMKRQGAEGDFRSNLHQGGNASIYKLNRKEKAVALAAAKSMGLGVCGVDMIISNRGPLVMEINSSPGLEGIEKSTEINVALKIMDYIEKNIITADDKKVKKRRVKKDNIGA